MSLSQRTLHRLTAVVLVGLLFAHFAAFINTLRRYTAGAQYTFIDMIRHVDWQPPLGWAPLTCAYVLVLGFGCALLWKRLTSVDRADPILPGIGSSVNRP
jgi:hypothetical protein